MNYQINEIHFDVDERTKVEHIQNLFSAVEQYNRNNNRTNIELIILEVEHKNATFSDRAAKMSRTLAEFSGLHSPTKYFELNIPVIMDWEPIFTGIVSCLEAGANFNQFSFGGATLFGDDVPVEGFKEFCEYFMKHSDRLISLEICFERPTVEALPYLVQLIRKSTSLKSLRTHASVHSSPDLDMLDALANSNVKIVELFLLDGNPDLCSKIGKLIGNCPTLEELRVLVLKADFTVDSSLKDGLKKTQSLKKFSLRLTDINIDLSILEENESIVEWTINGNTNQDDIKALGVRNRKLQNERVRSTIILLYNIVRSNQRIDLSNELISALPSDIWVLIMSCVKYPGVTTLDFGKIIRSIFNDRSIRRVI